MYLILLFIILIIVSAYYKEEFFTKQTVINYKNQIVSCEIIYHFQKLNNVDFRATLK